MKCLSCGQKINEGADFCEHCGKRVSHSPPQDVKSEPSPGQKKDHVSLKTDEKQTESGSATENPGEEEENSSSEEVPTKSSMITKLIISVGALVMVLIVAHFFKSNPPPPPPPASVTIPSKNFYIDFQKAIQEMGEAKSFYRSAFASLPGAETRSMTSPESNPILKPLSGEKAISENSDSSVSLKALGDLARAKERFKYLKETFENIKNESLSETEEGCRKEFLQAINKFIEADDSLNSRIKALYEQKPDKAPESVVQEAMAQYEMADKITVDLLMDGCRGDFFKFVRSQNDDEKKAAFLAYQTFFAERFPFQREAIETRLNFRLSQTMP